MALPCPPAAAGSALITSHQPPSAIGRLHPIRAALACQQQLLTIVQVEKSIKYRCRGEAIGRGSRPFPSHGRPDCLPLQLTCTIEPYHLTGRVEARQRRYQFRPAEPPRPAAASPSLLSRDLPNRATPPKGQATGREGHPFPSNTIPCCLTPTIDLHN